MNVINQNGNKIIQTSEYIEVNGVKTLLPDYVKSGNRNSLSVIGGNITINGYKFDPIKKTFNEKTGFWRYILNLLS